MAGPQPLEVRVKITFHSVSIALSCEGLCSRVFAACSTVGGLIPICLCFQLPALFFFSFFFHHCSTLSWPKRCDLERYVQYLCVSFQSCAVIVKCFWMLLIAAVAVVLCCFSIVMFKISTSYWHGKAGSNFVSGDTESTPGPHLKNLLIERKVELFWLNHNTHYCEQL